MLNIPATLHQELQTVLINCGPFSNDQTLRAHFVSEPLAAWQAKLPQAHTIHDRVQQTIALLAQHDTAEGENALTVFLQYLSNTIDPLDSCHGKLAALARQMRQLPKLANLPLEPLTESAPLPPGSSRLPHGRNPDFVDRYDEMQRIAQLLQTQATHAVVVTGLGGQGKSQLASEFVYRYGAYFEGGVFWLNFAHPEAIAAQVVSCGYALELPHFDTLPFPEQVRRVQSVWEAETPRLLIFDNCENPTLLAKWRPRQGGCRILLTCRWGEWARQPYVTQLVLPTLPPPHSVELLRNHQPNLTIPTAQALAAQVGHLPLALHVMGCYLAEYGAVVTGEAYLAKLQQEGLHLLEQWDEAWPKPTEHEPSVYQTFQPSYEALAPYPTAQSLLHRLACFAWGEPIPYDLIALSMATDRNDMESAVALEQYLKQLVRLGLVERSPDQSVIIHPLMGEFVQRIATTTTARHAVEEAMAKRAHDLNVKGDPNPVIAIQSHLKLITDKSLAEHHVHAADLASELGYHLNIIGNYVFANYYYDQSLAICLEVFGEKHLDTAASLNNLGELYRAMGKPIDALSYYRRALAIIQEVLGETHSHIMATNLNNLGLLYQDMGEYDIAHSYQMQALVIRREVFGEKHSDTAQSLNNLGLLYQTMEKYTEARSYYEQALAIFQEILGRNNWYTATSLNNLGLLYDNMKDYEIAYSYYEQSLAILRDILGEKHPDTASNLNNMGALYYAMGKYDLARPCYEQALSIFREVWGDQHPRTAGSLTNLALLYYHEENLLQAAEVIEQALAIFEAMLGENHPDTQTARRHLTTIEAALRAKDFDPKD